MNIIYIIGVLVLAKLLYSNFKSRNVNKEQIYNSEENMIEIKSSIEKSKEIEEDLSDINFSIEKPKELGKNKWLNPPDEFVKKWKKSKHYELETYKLK